ncbi:MAG: hypothetical protein JO291_08240 [Acidimicrobiia bacterium]|nr:hypothetical protein [Acidimicrobiia bacterium]
MRRCAAATCVVVASVVVVSGGAAHAASGPTNVGGQSVAPSTGTTSGDLSFNGSKTLAVWTAVKGRGHLVRGRLLAPDTTSEEDSFSISALGVEVRDPRAAWNGSSWLVVWQTNGGQGYGEILGQRVSAAGELIGDRLTIREGLSEGPAVAARPNGGFFVTWTYHEKSPDDDPGPVDVYGRRVSAAGQVLDDAYGLRISTDTDDHLTDDYSGHVAWNGSSYLVVWEATQPGFVMDPTSQVMASQRAANGSLLHAGVLTSVGHTRNPAVASDGHDFLVAFTERGASEVDIIGVKVTSSFAKTRFPIAKAAGNRYGTTIAFNGVYLVTWVDQSDDDHVWGARVKSDDTLVDHTAVALTPGPDDGTREPAVAPGGSHSSQFAVLYTSSTDGTLGLQALGVQWAPK